MKISLKLILLLLLLLSSVLAGCDTDAGVRGGKPATKEAFLQCVRQAVEGQDVEAMLVLFRSEGHDEAAMQKRRQEITHDFEELAGNQVDKIELVPLEKGFRKEWSALGVRYRVNVNVLGRVRINYSHSEGTGSWSIPYGETDGHYYFNNTIEEKL